MREKVSKCRGLEVLKKVIRRTGGRGIGNGRGRGRGQSPGSESERRTQHSDTSVGEFPDITRREALSERALFHYLKLPEVATILNFFHHRLVFLL